MSLSTRSIDVLKTAIADTKASKEIQGTIGIQGGFSVHSDASIKVSSGDFLITPQSGIETGSYEIRFLPAIAEKMLGIQSFQVGGFTPRSPQTAETCAARVTGYNKDANGLWYITVQIALLSDNSLSATPPEGFVIGLDVKILFSEPGAQF